MKTTRLLSNWRGELLLLGVTLILTSDTGLAQSREQQDRSSQQNQPAMQPAVDRPAPDVLVAPNEDYRISPGDTIDIQVQDAAELSVTARISAAGTFEMPFLGNIKAHGRTMTELSRLIAELLRDQDYLKQPQVTAMVRQYNSQTFFIHGAIRTPGVYLVEGKPTLIKLISLAGGLGENHGATALVMRPKESQKGKPASPTDPLAPSPTIAEQAMPENAESGQYELIKANINAIYEGRFEQNVKIEPGDIVYVPPANVFFVAGEVNAPGSFKLKDGTTLRQAISLAQGTTFRAKLGNGVIFRDNSQTGQREEIHVDIAAVMSGKKDDLPIMPNDVIIIPNSRVKSVSSSLLMALGISAARVPSRY